MEVPTSAVRPSRRVGIGRVVAVAAVVVIMLVLAVGVVLVAVNGADRPELLFPEWTGDQVRVAAGALGVPVAWLVRFVLLFEVLLATAGATAAVVLLRGGRMTGFRCYLAVVVVLNAALGGAILPAVGALVPAVADPAAVLQGVAWCAFLPAAYGFPDGRFVPLWSRWLVLGWAVLLVVLTVAPPEVVDGPVAAGSALALFGSCAFAQVYRYMRVSGPIERAQQRWVALAVALRFGYMIATIATPVVGLLQEPSAPGLATELVTIPISYGISAALAAAITVAIVRHRLYDVDVWITRALVYTVLTAFVVGTYVLVVGGVGALVGGSGGLLLPLVATVVVALAVEQVRGRAQRRIRRLVYGSRGEPYAVVAELGRRLGGAVEPDAVADTIVATVADALKAPFVELAVAGGPVAVRGMHAEPVTAFPVRHRGTELGELRVGGEPLTAADRQLLAELARQAGLAVHAGQVTAELRRSRRALASSREEERRRLHRDLHDGLGPTLAGLYQRMDAAHRLIGSDPDRARSLLADSRAQTLRTIDEIRELVDALRPAVLDDLGLAGALALVIERLAPPPGPPVVELHADPLPPLPAGVEVAAYRIVVEAVTNAMRHSDATWCRVEIMMDAVLRVCIEDDGRGIDPEARPGGGTRTMRERAEELGGTLLVTDRPGGGTAVTAVFPLDEEPST